MPRTYLPRLLELIILACAYTARHDETIRAYLPPEALPAYEAWREACDALRALMPEVLTPQ